MKRRYRICARCGRRAATAGASKSNVKSLNKLDVIASDKRLVELYLSVVKDMAIHYGVA